MKILISFTTILIFFFGCNSNPTDSDADNNFSIFLTKNIENNSPSNISLDKIILEDEPILSNQLIESYVWDNHKISYSNETKEKIKLKEPLFGRYFIVIAQNQRIYWDLFTDDASSTGCQNPVIRLWPRHPDKSSFVPDVFVIERAYPEYFGNDNYKDLREDLRIYNALLKSGKLK
jgi:hypothetical protein